MAAKKPAKKPVRVSRDIHLNKNPKAGTSKTDAIKRKNIFVDQYFILNRNGAAAARAAGYSENSARSIACELLTDPYIKARIEIRSQELLKYVELTAQEVIQSMARALRFDPRKMYDDTGKLLAMHELPDEVALELEGADFDTTTMMTPGTRTPVGTTVTAKLKYPKKSVARDQAMRFFGLFAKDKGGFDPDDGLEAPAATAVTIDFKDARRQPKKGG